MDDTNILKSKVAALHRRYMEALKEYCHLFAEKHDLVVYDEDIRTDVPILMSDYYVDTNDIMYDLDNEIEKGVWEEWYDVMLELHTMGARTCNFDAWCKGFRPYTPEQIEKMKESQRRIDQYKAELEGLIEQSKKNF